MSIKKKKKTIYDEEYIYGFRSVHDTDKMIKEYDKTLGLGKSAESKIDIKTKILKVETFGFGENGDVLHNYPCPICLKRTAKYKSGDIGSFFSPCAICEDQGYEIIKTNDKRDKQ